MTRINTRIALTLLCLFFLPVQAYAELYKCTGADGAITYSDKACDGGEAMLRDVAVNEDGLTREDGSPLVVQQGGESIEDKNRKAIDNCIAHMIESGRFPDPDASSVIVKSHRFSIVGVDMVGARRMLYLTVNPKNRYGAYDGFQTVECLLMGDNITINKGEYELVE